MNDIPNTTRVISTLFENTMEDNLNYPALKAAWDNAKLKFLPMLKDVESATLNALKNKPYYGYINFNDPEKIFQSNPLHNEIEDNKWKGEGVNILGFYSPAIMFYSEEDLSSFNMKFSGNKEFFTDFAAECSKLIVMFKSKYKELQFDEYSHPNDEDYGGTSGFRIIFRFPYPEVKKDYPLEESSDSMKNINEGLGDYIMFKNIPGEVLESQWDFSTDKLNKDFFSDYRSYIKESIDSNDLITESLGEKIQLLWNKLKKLIKHFFTTVIPSMLAKLKRKRPKPEPQEEVPVREMTVEIGINTRNANTRWISDSIQRQIDYLDKTLNLDNSDLQLHMAFTSKHHLLGNTLKEELENVKKMTFNDDVGLTGMIFKDHYSHLSNILEEYQRCFKLLDIICIKIDELIVKTGELGFGDPDNKNHLLGNETPIAFPSMKQDVIGIISKLQRDVMEINKAINFFESPPTSSSSLGESTDTPNYNTDMTEIQAKKTLRALSQSLMDDFKEDDKNKISQYTANIYANVISNNLLHKWAKGYRKVKITLDSYQSFLTFEFLTPPMSQDFVSRFINGRETLDGFLHRTPEIRIKMSPRIFHNMKDPDDAYNFFKTAIQYYDSKVERVGKRLMFEVMKLGHNMKHLIGNSKLSGIVTYPLTLLFVFDDVQISDKNTFTVSDEDVQSINKFVRGIASHYASPEKEKKKIVEDIKDLVKELKESCDSENLPQLSYLAEAVNDLYSGRYNDDIDRASINFIESHIDRDYKPTGQLKVLYEKFGVKKLKKIPQNIVTYITIEAENMRDSNDKMMIASYCISKIEIVEWYIELLVVGSKRYLVPHTKPYLENLRTQLIACYSKIMNTKIENPSSRPIIDIQYPKGYEG